MSEVRVNGIVIGAKDFKEADKIITIYTLERGIVYAKLAGVKKPNAKLKAAKELFCFAQFDLVSKGDFFSVTGANIIESFFCLSQDLAKFYGACNILEVLKVVGRENENNQILFLETLKALDSIGFKGSDPKLVLVKFLIKIFEALGYDLSLNRCGKCSMPFSGKRFFSPADGVVTCLACKGAGAVEISPQIHSVMRLCQITNFDKLSSLKLPAQAAAEALSILTKNFEDKFDRKINITH